MQLLKSKINREMSVLVMGIQSSHLNLLTEKAFPIIADVLGIDMTESG